MDVERPLQRYRLRVTAGPSYDTSTHGLVAVNATGDDGVCHIESEHATVDLCVRIQGYTGFPANSPLTHPYFTHPVHDPNLVPAGDGNLYSLSIRLVPKHPVPASDLVFGNDFDRPLRDRMPPGTNAALRFVRWWVDPGLEGDAYADRPWLYGPAMSSWGRLRVCGRPEEEGDAAEMEVERERVGEAEAEGDSGLEYESGSSEVDVEAYGYGGSDSEAEAEAAAAAATQAEAAAAGTRKYEHPGADDGDANAPQPSTARSRWQQQQQQSESPHPPDPKSGPASFASQVVLEGSEGSGSAVRASLGIPLDPAARKKHFLTSANRDAFVFEAGRMYKADFGNAYLGFDDFSIRLPIFTVRVTDYIEEADHELRYVLKNKTTGDVYFVLLFSLMFVGDKENSEGTEWVDNMGGSETKADDSANETVMRGIGNMNVSEEEILK